MRCPLSLRSDDDMAYLLGYQFFAQEPLTRSGAWLMDLLLLTSLNDDMARTGQPPRPSLHSLLACEDMRGPGPSWNFFC